jgi:class 3 adenylate cyclase
MRSFQRTCLDVVGRWDGYVSKFLGDGAVIFFGWPRSATATTRSTGCNRSPPTW